MAACGVDLLAAAARAEVVNGHFEDPSDLYGWTADGPVTVERVGSTATLQPNRLEIMTRNTGEPFGPAHATLVGGAVV